MSPAVPPPRRITPTLWFDSQAEEAARFYASTFERSSVGTLTHSDAGSAEVSGQPEGSVLTVSFELDGVPMTGLNGGPRFRFTPAISFHVSCGTGGEVDALFHELSEGGTVLMPLQEYPFSERYAWLNDRYGVSWQLDLRPERPGGEKITPSLMFVGEPHGKAEEAMRFYTSLFDDAGIETVARYGPDDGDPAVGTVKHAEFSLAGQRFRAMDSSLAHDFGFSEAVSFLVPCRDQAEVDHFWYAFIENGEESQCGWLKDAWGVSWQIVPTVLLDMLQDQDRAKARRVTEAVLGMRKIEITELKEAYAGG